MVVCVIILKDSLTEKGIALALLGDQPTDARIAKRNPWVFRRTTKADLVHAICPSFVFGLIDKIHRRREISSSVAGELVGWCMWVYVTIYAIL